MKKAVSLLICSYIWMRIFTFILISFSGLFLSCFQKLNVWWKQLNWTEKVGQQQMLFFLHSGIKEVMSCSPTLSLMNMWLQSWNSTLGCQAASEELTPVPTVVNHPAVAMVLNPLPLLILPLLTYNISFRIEIPGRNWLIAPYSTALSRVGKALFVQLTYP